MSLLNPTEAPEVILQVLPGTAVGAAAAFGTVASGQATRQCLTVTCWTESDKQMIGFDGETDESFVDNKCYDCRYHTDTYEVYVNGIDIYDSESGEDCYFEGEITCSSPCPSYNDGIGDVSFPCLAGHDGPGSDGDEIRLPLSFMRYDIAYSEVGEIWVDEASIQGTYTANGRVYVGERHNAVNCFNDHHICWGEVDTVHEDLNGLIAFFETSNANEDLTSFYSHRDNMTDAQSDSELEVEDLTLYPGSLAVDRRISPRALVCAPARWFPDSFMQLSIAGCQINQGVAMVQANLYPQVAIDDDTVMDVWATDETAIGTRLLFMKKSNGYSCMLGAVPADFDLSKYEPSTSLIDKCKSLLPS